LNMKNAPGPEGEAATPPAQLSGRIVIRVARDTCIVFGVIYGVPLLVGLELLRERQAWIGLSCVAAAAAFFSHYALQSIVFDGESMLVRRPPFSDRPILVREISNVVVALRRQSGRPYWQCVLSGGATVMCRFNPRVYSPEGLDAVYERIRRLSPNVQIFDEAYELRREGRPRDVEPPGDSEACLRRVS